jgi:hypothetical protein
LESNYPMNGTVAPLPTLTAAGYWEPALRRRSQCSTLPRPIGEIGDQE